jgi:hypothetical protein
MFTFYLLNNSGKYIQSFQDIKAAYSYASLNHIDNFSIQTAFI